ncbi:hypothetical protein SAMN05216226_1096 [Halovenus aranensis]|jgi:hypothetical protein|uniref:Uncharacterized protein n=1 Tax=Halovenus aranensis TaxID=890420 RepID=A0A1G8WG27_9EURY|nr:hypothetical protein [Halovenus aranensis]SDJ77258.1 hypothetical protein SAMN05216226_1096 [Halovenus aranensis]
MFTLDVDRFTFELKDGALKHVGASNKSATAKLYDVESAEVREFGDERVKITCEDDSGNEIEVALGPEAASDVAQELTQLEAESEVFE